MCIARREVQCDTAAGMMMAWAWWCVGTFLGTAHERNMHLYTHENAHVEWRVEDLARINAA
jgi:hypothetical protein